MLLTVLYWLVTSTSTCSSHLIICCINFLLFLTVFVCLNSPTHIAHSGHELLIDLALLSDPTSLHSCNVLPPISKYHRVVSCHFVHQVVPCSARNERRIWLYSKADLTGAATLITDTDWDALISDCVDTSWANWKLKFLEIMSETIPMKTISARHNIPWLNLAILKKIRKRNSLYRKAKASGQSSIWTRYKALRNEIVKDPRVLKVSYFMHLSEASSNNPKQFWHLLHGNLPVPSLQSLMMALAQHLINRKLMFSIPFHPLLQFICCSTNTI